jgi:competence protein ComEA
MDRIAEWRPVEPAGPDGSAEEAESGAQAPAVAPEPHEAKPGLGLLAPVLIGVAAVGFAIAGAVALFAMSGTPRAAVAIDNGSSPGADASSPGVSQAAPVESPQTSIVVDVEGAVEKAGLWRLDAGSRVGDAISAAGGYSAQIDIEAATTQLNLAAVLADGQQIRVPLRGEQTPAPLATSGGQASPSDAGGGLIDVNTATTEQLDTLPGIGPVTAAKIIAARPFTSVDDLQQRGAVGASTFEKIKPLITVSP